LKSVGKHSKILIDEKYIHIEKEKQLKDYGNLQLHSNKSETKMSSEPIIADDRVESDLRSKSEVCREIKTDSEKTNQQCRGKSSERD
jgi:hypothetical protein